MGNHEAKHIRIFSHSLPRSPSQEMFIEQVSPKNYQDIVQYFESFPEYLELQDVILIHGLLEPGIKLVDQKKSVLIGAMSGDIYLNKKYPKPWYEYDHGDKPIIAGHHDYSKEGKPLIINDKIYLIDTGCCYGKNLTALLLPEFKLFTVKSRKNYWGLSRQNYKSKK